ncbi:MAG: peptidylprolyl isomerase [Oligoflexia bacterium]|nr:peptidylprolyl isomerase [Oligoflexia bacterium]
MSNFFVLTTTFIFLFSLSAHAALDANTVADINGKQISKEDFDRRYKESIQSFKFGSPTKANILNEIISFELGVQEAKKLGLDKDPQVVERMNAVLYQSLVETQLADKFRSVVNVTDNEAKSFCNRNPAVRTSHVFVPLTPSALKTEETAAYNKINEAQDALKKGMKFEQVVAKYSEGASTNGGDTGFVSKMDVDPAFYSSARKLKVGQVSQPVRSQLGLHLIKLTAIKDCNKINIPEWQRMVYEERREQIFQTYLSSLRSKAKISINDSLVKE